MDKIFVTGGNGFLGSHVVSKLKETYPQSTVTSLTSKACNLLDFQRVKDWFAFIKPDSVIHLAAVVGGIEANRLNPGKFAYENMLMGLNVIEACRLYEVKKLVLAGTICAYPCNTQVPFKEEDIHNGYPETTNAPYGIAKKAIHIVAKSYQQQYGLNTCSLFPVNLYGSRDNFDLTTSHVIPAMIRKFHEAKINNIPEVALWGDGSPTREFLYVEDCAEAFVKALNLNYSEPLNIGSGKEISIRDLALKIQKLTGYQGIIYWDCSKPNGQPRRCLDVSKAKQFLGWEAKTDFDTGLAKTFEWFKANNQGAN